MGNSDFGNSTTINMWIIFNIYMKKIFVKKKKKTIKGKRSISVIMNWNYRKSNIELIEYYVN